MDTVLNAIILLFWFAFFVATVLSLLSGLRKKPVAVESPAPKAEAISSESEDYWSKAV